MNARTPPTNPNTLGIRREEWVDVVKLLACILVALGHLFQSFSKTGLIDPKSLVYLYFNSTIYLFHVPVFFFCSGYLYQKASKIDSINRYFSHIGKKFVNLAVPYFTFSIITIALKMIFKGNTATPIQSGFFETLFLQPTSPYWFLYILFFLFLIIPPIRNRQTHVILLICVIGLKMQAVIIHGSSIYAVNGIMQHSLWFALGMSTFYIKLLPKVYRLSPFSLLFLPLTGALFASGIGTNFINPLLTLLGISLLVLPIYHWSMTKIFPAVLQIITPYTMHIFLLHTICAAPGRSLLFKVGISSLSVHLLVGITLSFFLPILIGKLAEHFRFLDFFFSPLASLRSKKQELNAHSA